MWLWGTPRCGGSTCAALEGALEGLLLWVSNQELAKINQVSVEMEESVSVEMERSVKQLESSKRVEKGQAEENANLARRVQRERDLQKQEASTPTPAAAHRPHPNTARKFLS